MKPNLQFFTTVASAHAAKGDAAAARRMFSQMPLPIQPGATRESTSDKRPRMRTYVLHACMLRACMLHATRCVPRARAALLLLLLLLP